MMVYGGYLSYGLYLYEARLHPSARLLTPSPPSLLHTLSHPPRSYNNNFAYATHDGFDFNMYYYGETGLVFDGESGNDVVGGSNIDSDGVLRAVKGAPAGTILGEFGRGESIPLVGDGRRLDSNSNADNV